MPVMKRTNEYDNQYGRVPNTVHAEHTPEEAARLDALWAQSEQGKRYQQMQNTALSFYRVQKYSLRVGTGIFLAIVILNFFCKFPHWLTKGSWDDFPLVIIVQHFCPGNDISVLLSPVYKGYNHLLLFILHLETWIACCFVVFLITCIIWICCKIRMNAIFRKMFFLRERA